MGYCRVYRCGYTLRGMTQSIERTQQQFDVDDAEHVELRERLAALVGVPSGEHLHPDKGRRLDA